MVVVLYQSIVTFLVCFLLLDLDMSHAFWGLTPVGRLSVHFTLFFLAVCVIGDFIVLKTVIVRACWVVFML